MSDYILKHACMHMPLRLELQRCQHNTVAKAETFECPHKKYTGKEFLSSTVQHRQHNTVAKGTQYLILAKVETFECPHKK